MKISQTHFLNFKSVLPPQGRNKADGWDELEKICSKSEKTKGMLQEQLKLLSSNGDENILALNYTPLDNSSRNEAFAFRVYKNLDDYKKDDNDKWFFPKNYIENELIVDFYGNHSYKISYGQLFSVKKYANIHKEKTNILLGILKNINTKGSEEYATLFGKANFGNIPKELTSKFRIKG